MRHGGPWLMKESTFVLWLGVGASLYAMWLFRNPQAAKYLQLLVMAFVLGAIAYFVLAGWLISCSEAQEDSRLPSWELCWGLGLLTVVAFGTWWAVAHEVPMKAAFADYIRRVQSGEYPAPEHEYEMPEEQRALFLRGLKKF